MKGKVQYVLSDGKRNEEHEETERKKTFFQLKWKVTFYRHPM